MTQLTGDQQRAIEFLDEFVRQGWQHAVLKGYAGVGKTWLVGNWLTKLVEARPNLRILVCAPTNKALDVLRSKCGHLTNKVDFRTLDSYLGYRVKRNDDGLMERKQVGRPDNYDIVMVDEASMVKSSYKAELDAQGVQVLYVGDPAQLQPIGEDVSLAFDSEHVVEMTEVVRQEQGNPINMLAHFLRERIEDNRTFILPDVRNLAAGGDNRITFMGKGKLLDWAETALNKGLDARMLAFDNLTVNENNAAMHARRYPADELFGAGEMALVNETYEYSDEILLMNGELLRVVACTEAEPIQGVRVFDVSVEYKGEQVTVDDEEPVPQVLTVKVAVDEAHRQEVFKSLTEQIYRLRNEKNKVDPRSEMKRWSELDREIQDLNERRRPLNKLCPLRHSYASTVHKSQGSTYDVAFVDWGSIYRSRDMRARLLYVAATRPSKFLVIATN